MRRRPCLGSTSASSRSNRRDSRRPFPWDTSTCCPRTRPPRTSLHTIRPRSRQNTADHCPGNRPHCSSLRLVRSLVRRYRLRRRRRVPWKTRSRQQPSRDRSPRAPDSLGSRGLPTIVKCVACGPVYRICTVGRTATCPSPCHRGQAQRRGGPSLVGIEGEKLGEVIAQRRDQVNAVRGA